MRGGETLRALRVSTAVAAWLTCGVMSAAAGNTGYVYDALGRVVQVAYPSGGQINYTYDDAGNRTKVTTSGVVANCNSIAQGTNCFSANGQYKLYMAPDGNLVLYTAANAVVWSTQTWNTNGNIAMVEADGNFVVKNATSGVIHWQTGTWGNQGANLSVTDTGDVRLTSSAGQLLWARSHNSFVLGVGQKRTSFQNGSYFEMMTGGNLGVYNASGALLWSTGLTGSAATAAKYYTDGNFALINTATGAPVWQTFTSGNPGAIFLYGDGGLVIADQWWSPVWSNNYGRVKVLRFGQSLKSANNAYTLTLQHDHNIVLKDANGVEKWASYTYTTDGNWLRFQEDGNLVYSGPNSGLIFASQTYGNYDATFEISNDGVIRVVKPSGQVLWAANESYYIAQGGSIKSSNQQYELTMFGDGNLVLRVVGGSELWASGTYNDPPGAKFIDGELKVVNGNTTEWSSGTGGNPGATIEVANTGQLIIRSAAGATLWTSNTAAVSYMLTSGQSILSANGLYRLILQGDGNLVLYKTAGGILWASNTYSGASGVLFEDGNLKIMNGTTATWQSNTGNNPGATLTVSNTGQVIVKTATGTNLWVSNTAQNNNPVATADTATTAHNTAVSINVLANDSDIDQDTLSVSAVGTASGGTASLGQGGVIYTPNTGFSGTDSFTYTLSDGRGGAATGTVTVTVAAPPVITINVTSVSNLRTLANSAGYAGGAGVSYEFVVPAGTTIMGASGGGTAIDTGTWPAGVTLTLVVNGNVYGGGGTGGPGMGGPGDGPLALGGSGGHAINAQATLLMTVNSGASVKGGGGGGGGATYSSGSQRSGGGGGGGGFPNGPGGAGGVADVTGFSGYVGTTSGGGTPGTQYVLGGVGGAAGLNGGNGSSSPGTPSSGTGGAAGFAIKKNGNTVTVTNNGTITGTQG